MKSCSASVPLKCCHYCCGHHYCAIIIFVVVFVQLLLLLTMRMCIKKNFNWQKWASNWCMVLQFEMLWAWSSF